jgi:hypothetical protein
MGGGAAPSVAIFSFSAANAAPPPITSIAAAAAETSHFEICIPEFLQLRPKRPSPCQT